MPCACTLIPTTQAGWPAERVIEICCTQLRAHGYWPVTDWPPPFPLRRSDHNGVGRNKNGPGVSCGPGALTEKAVGYFLPLRKTMRIVGQLCPSFRLELLALTSLKVIGSVYTGGAAAPGVPRRPHRARFVASAVSGTRSAEYMMNCRYGSS